jgi:peptide subunit release factor 1 (eRF1)
LVTKITLTSSKTEPFYDPINMTLGRTHHTTHMHTYPSRKYSKLWRIMNMKITLAIPKNKKNIKDFLTKEINSAQNIQDQNLGSFVYTSLKRIHKNVETGKVYLVDEEEFTVYDYPLDEFIYHCGKDFKIPETPVNFSNRYLLVVLSTDDAIIAELEGSGKKKVLWKDSSYIHGKAGGGGQSKERFRRQREHHRKLWFRKIGDKIKDIYYGLDN